MNTSLLDVFHDNPHDQSVLAITNRIYVNLDGVFEELVDQNRGAGASLRVATARLLKRSRLGAS